MIDKLMQHGIGIGGGSNIKSVQHGVTTFSQSDVVKNITVNSVDEQKSIVLISSYVNNTTVNQISRLLSAAIVSGTNIEIKRGSASNHTAPIEVSWQLIEFDDTKSIQKGIAMRDGTGETRVSIEAIDTTKSLIFYTFHMSLAGTGVANSNTFDRRVRIISSTEIGILTPDTFDEVYWQVVEFK